MLRVALDNGLGALMFALGSTSILAGLGLMLSSGLLWSKRIALGLVAICVCGIVLWAIDRQLQVLDERPVGELVSFSVAAEPGFISSPLTRVETTEGSWVVVGHAQGLKSDPVRLTEQRNGKRHLWIGERAWSIAN